MLAVHASLRPHDVIARSVERRDGYLPLAFGVLLALLLASAWWVYRPGLTGVFLFDDYANLPALGAYGPVDNATAFLRYITSGHADPTGRPLALLSFLIDAQDWPADPAPFKRTSVLLHLLNGALLCWLLLQLGRVLVGDERRAAAAALFGSALWMLHPLFVSTVLYVVQREAMLPATFTLAGLVAYVGARGATARGSRSAPFFAALAIGTSTALAFASKANGILLPILAWLVEIIVLSPAQSAKDQRAKRNLTLVRRFALELPCVLVVLWIVWTGASYAIKGVPEFRSWTFGERLMTEGRVVSNYIMLLLVPHPYTAGVFNDAITVSKGMLSPASTLVGASFLSALIVFAIAVRRRLPALALAILFFFAGHLLESTVIPLELYYEHRNYLPALLLFWPLGLWAAGDGSVVAVRRLLLIGLPVLLGALTRMNTDLWGNAQDQALVWAAKNPESPRAQAYAAQTERARGRPLAAISRLRHVPVDQAEDIQVALNLLGAECDAGHVDAGDLGRAEKSLRNARVTGQLGYEWFGEAIGRTQSNHPCAGLGTDEIARLLDAAARNSNAESYGRRQDNLNLRARLSLVLKQPDAALSYFNQSLDAKPLPEVALQQAALLGGAGYPREALRHLDHFDEIWKPDVEHIASMSAVHERMLLTQGYWQSEIAALRAALTDAVRTEGGAGAGSSP